MKAFSVRLVVFLLVTLWLSSSSRVEAANYFVESVPVCQLVNHAGSLCRTWHSVAPGQVQEEVVQRHSLVVLVAGRTLYDG